MQYRPRKNSLPRTRYWYEVGQIHIDMLPQFPEAVLDITTITRHVSIQQAPYSFSVELRQHHHHRVPSLCCWLTRKRAKWYVLCFRSVSLSTKWCTEGQLKEVDDLQRLRAEFMWKYERAMKRTPAFLSLVSVWWDYRGLVEDFDELIQERACYRIETCSGGHHNHQR